MKLSLASIPSLYPDTYTDTVENHLLVYNPLSEKGLTVLNREAKYLFSLIDSTKTLGNILDIAKTIDPKVSFNIIEQIFKDFLSYEIIYFDRPKSKQKIFSRKLRVLDVWLHITNQCNLRCKYCYVNKSSQKMSYDTAHKAIGKVFLSAKKHLIEKITFKFSGGESLLELPKLLLLVKEIRLLSKTNNIKVDLVILTNGVLISEEVAKILKKNNLRAAISLDGLGKYNDQNRVFPGGKGSFRFVKKGIDNLRKYQIPFSVSVTITSKNIYGIPAVTKYLLQRFIPFSFNFYRENPFVHEKLGGNDEKLIKYLKIAYHLIYSNIPRRSIINGLLDRVNFRKPHLYTCSMGSSYLVINHDGSISSCQMTLKNPIGSIRDKDLIETINKGDFIIPKGLTVEGKTYCRDCQWRYICCGGCPLLTFLQKGRYDISSPYCSVYKALIPEILRIEAKRLIEYGNN